MLTNLGTTYNSEQRKRTPVPLPMSAVYNKHHFISQFVALHHHSTQPALVNQLLTAPLPGTFAEYWILYDDMNRPIACAAANTVMSDMSVGYVGLFEAKEAWAGTTVLRTAIEWLRRGGVRQFNPVRQILGPVNLTTWLQYRLRVDNDDLPSMSYEPRHPAFYQQCFEQAGFVKAMDYHSTFFDIDQIIHGYEKNVRDLNLEKYGMVMQPWNTLDFAASLNPEHNPDLTPQDNVAKRIYDLTLELFRGKELFDEGLTRQYHRQMVLNDMISRPEVDNASLLDLSAFVVDTATGEDIGYMACWKEDHHTLVLKTVGFVPKVRKTKVYAIALLETMKRAKDVWGCTRVVCALMNENSTAISEHMGGKAIRHTYRLYMHKPKATPAFHDKENRLAVEADISKSENHANLANLGQKAFKVSSSTAPVPTTSQTTFPESSSTSTATRASISTLAAQEAESQQKRQQDLLRQAYVNQQRLKSLAQRSQGRPMARL